jgi:hypothetical protein
LERSKKGQGEMKIKLLILIANLSAVLFAQTPATAPRMTEKQRDLLVAGARTAPSPKTVTVTISVDGVTHMLTYSAAGAEATKNRLVLQGKISLQYTSDDFATALLKDLDAQATADLSNPLSTTAAEAAKLDAQKAASAAQATSLSTDAQAAKGTLK